MIDEDRATVREALALRIALGASMLFMLALSWPIWTNDCLFPQVPFLPWLGEPIGLARWLRFIALLLTLLVGIMRPRVWLSSIGILAWLFAEDQHRLQPWVYQFCLFGLGIASLPPRLALWASRVVLIALYVHSGLSKLDATFSREMGPLFLGTMFSPIGVDIRAWPASLRAALSLSLPLFELLVGVGLITPSKRRLALVGAVVLHLSLIAILGPWALGLGHSTIVLIWNMFLLVEALILFRGNESLMPRTPTFANNASAGRLDHLPRHLAHGTILTILVLLALFLPLGERWGVWDSWPSFALYASHVERVLIDVRERDDWPEGIRRHVAEISIEPGSPWHRLDVTEWSLAERGTPPYPQARAILGVAEELAQ
jgi:Methylamine utilisation protein MauE